MWSWWISPPAGRWKVMVAMSVHAISHPTPPHLHHNHLFQSSCQWLRRRPDSNPEDQEVRRFYGTNTRHHTHISLSSNLGVSTTSSLSNIPRASNLVILCSRRFEQRPYENASPIICNKEMFNLSTKCKPTLRLSQPLPVKAWGSFSWS
jgi:hypothetical protein